MDNLLEIIYPSSLYCIYCGSLIDKTRYYALCDDCIKKLHWVGKKTCEKCGKILNDRDRHGLCYDCREQERNFDKGYTCAGYDLYERKILMDLKYKGKSYLGMKLGDALADRMRFEGEKFHIVTSVPVHRKKEKMRGYNQAAVMAKRFTYKYREILKEQREAERSRSPETLLYRELLVRTKMTEPMKGLDISQRQENVREAFVLKKGASVQGKRIALVDDIFTTGSTMDACSKILKENGAERVIALTFAAGANIPPRSD